MWTALSIYLLLITIASLSGGWLPSLIRLNHTRLQVGMSFVGGLMLGVALLLFLPHAAEASGSFEYATQWACVGLIATFLLIRMFHVHHHHHEGTSDQSGGHHHHHDEAEYCDAHQHQWSWLMLGVGLTLHSMMDGVAVASNVMTDVDSVSPGANAWPGFGGFLAVFLHKPLDSLTIVSVMAAGGWSVRRQWLVNTAFAAAFPIATVAAVAAFSLGNQVPGSTPSGLLVGAALAFSAGAFLCVALADLLPEVRFHTHDRLKLSIALLAGVGLSLALSLFHYHGEAGGEHHDGVEHNDHAGHDHP